MPRDPLLQPPLERSQRRRERILDVATLLATEHGLAAVTSEAIAVSAGIDPAAIDPAAIGYYFGDRRTLIVEILRELRFRRHERLGTLLANLPAVGSPVADWNAAAGEAARGLIWLCGTDRHTMWELLIEAAHEPELAVEAAESVDALQESVGQLVVACGIARGELLGGPLIVLVFGLVSAHRMLGSTEQDLIDDLSHSLLALINGHLSVVEGLIPGLSLSSEAVQLNAPT